MCPRKEHVISSYLCVILWRYRGAERFRLAAVLLVQATHAFSLHHIFCTRMKRDRFHRDEIPAAAREHLDEKVDGNAGRVHSVGIPGASFPTS